MLKMLTNIRAWSPEQLASIVPFPDKTEAIRRFALPENRGKQIVAFHTKDTVYTNEAARMSASAQRLGLNVSISQYDGTGSWVRNASMKPTFLLDQRTVKRGPMLYVDVDSVFHNDPWPALDSHDGDVAVYYTEPDAKYNGGRVLVAATILINDTPGAKRLLEVWKAKCDEDPDELDQIVLQKIIDRDQASEKPEFDIRHLNVALCWIFDRQQNAADIVYIEQLQASRVVNEKKSRLIAKKKLRRRRQRVQEIEQILNDGSRDGLDLGTGSAAPDPFVRRLLGLFLRYG